MYQINHQIRSADYLTKKEIITKVPLNKLKPTILRNMKYEAVNIGCSIRFKLLYRPFKMTSIVLLGEDDSGEQAIVIGLYNYNTYGKSID